MGAREQEEMLTFMTASVQRIHQLEEVDIPVANFDEFTVLFGLIAQTHRLVDAYLVLRDEGLGREGTVLVRGAFEHAITAQAAYLTHDGCKELYERFQVRQRAYWTKIGDALSSDEIRDTIAAWPAIDFPPRGANFSKHVLEPLDVDGFLAGIYDSLSLVLHPTHATLDFVLDEDGSKVLHHGRTDGRSDYYTNYAGAISCLLARWVLARLLRDDEELARLDTLSDELEIPVRLDHQLSPEKQRFRGEIEQQV